MTEAEWDSTDRPHLMHPLLCASRKRADIRARNRRYRLVACAFCRDLWDVLDDERSRRAVEVSERFADGLADESELARAKVQAWEAHCRGDGPRQEAARRTGRQESDFGLADHAGGWVAHKDAVGAAQKAASNAYWVRRQAPDPAGMWQLCDLIREVFGNPLRVVAFAPAWRTADVIALAHAAYENRSLPSGRLEPARLGVLADALEEAGCADEHILAHLRGPGPHVRGCWALDLILGKE